MRVVRREKVSAILVLSMFVITITFVPEVVLFSLFSANPAEIDKIPPNIMDSTPIDKDVESVPRHSDRSILSTDSPVDGILNPVTVEQSGYAASGNISARTDNFQNLQYDLPLDVVHNWIADEAEVLVWNLQKLYAVNGSFDEGIPGINAYPNGSVVYHPLGWDANSTDTDTYADDVQIATYDSSGRKFVVVESQGGKVGQTSYAHVAGTRIVWSQFVQNTPYTEDFQLSFDYSYIRGPIDGPTGLTPVVGNCSLALFIDGVVVWNMSLLLLSQRGVWYSLKNNPITISGVPSSFTLELGLVIDETLLLNYKTADYDGDPGHLPDGVGNAAYITVYLDDVSFTKAVPPTPQEVQLEFGTGGVSTPVTGTSGLYSASLVNTSFWLTSPVSIALTSNTSVSFDYVTRLFSHRFTNSNWRTDISSIGVSYTVNHGFSLSLTFYAYVGYLGNYEEPEMIITYPIDWENITVSDPFLSDLTGNCTIESGGLSVPTSIIDRLGWWEIKLESPNYAISIDPQISDSSWRDENIFRIGNTTRANITIGTATQIIEFLTNVNVTWFKPLDIVWVSELISGGSSGQIYSSSQTFASGSSPAGEWWVEVYWTNGTEVAYDRASFQVHHSANLLAEHNQITTDAGLTITGIVRYTDGDTGAYLMDTSATLEGNWSISLIPFAPNSIQNWWEADFDTSITGAGDFTILVTATREYYDDASCIITVHAINVTRLTSPNAPWTAAEWGGDVSLIFRYEAYNSTTASWTHVRNTTDVSVSINWTFGYWTVLEDIDSGFYTVTLNSNVVPAGTYLLNTTFIKPHHYSKTLFLTLILSPLTSSLVIYDGLSDRVDLEEPKALKLGYFDKSGNPVQGAYVTVDSIFPSSGLSHTPIESVAGEAGNYTLTLTPHVPTVFTVRFYANGSNAQPASSVFVLVVNDVSTNLEIFTSPSTEIGLTDTYNVTFRYELSNGTGIENAAISVVYSGPSGKLRFNPGPSSFGNYSIEFAADLPSTYVITIIAYKPFHQRASDSFSLIISNIPTELTMSVGSSAKMGLSDTFELIIRYQMVNGTGIEDASINIVHSGTPLALNHPVTPLGFGNYSIQFTATLSSEYLVTIVASKQYCQGSSSSFLLSVLGINTTLTSLNGTVAFVGFGKDYRLFVHYTNTSGYDLVGANVFVASADPGITWSTAQVEGPGVYSILLTPLVSNTLSVVVQASLMNHQSKTIFFTLTVTAIPTTLLTLNSSTSIAVDRNFTVYLHFQDEASNNLENASLGFLTLPANLTYSPFEELGNGIYRVTLSPLFVDSYDVVFRASKVGYQTDYAGFVLTATIIQTELRIAGDLLRDSITYSEQTELLVFYTRSGTESRYNITEAAIRVETSTSGLQWSLSEELGGGYRVIITPQRTGNWTVYIYAGRNGYEESSAQFNLEVIPITISIEIITELRAIEDSTFSVTVKLTEGGSTIPIDGAYVTYRFSPARQGTFRAMNATESPGEYTFTYTVPLLFGAAIYRLEINAEKENYHLAAIIDESFIIDADPIKDNLAVITGTSGIGISLVVFFVALRIYSGRKKKQLSHDLAIKQR
ncbi:MAG: hypothetical protein ACFFDV_10690, partial [Candidatus Thorarchaeota archaeon]